MELFINYGVEKSEPMTIAQFKSGLGYEIKKEMSYVYLLFRRSLICFRNSYPIGVVRKI